MAWVISLPARPADVDLARSVSPVVSFVPGPISEIGEARERAIFDEILRAQGLATTEANQSIAEGGGGQWPLAPSSVRKHESQRVARTSDLTSRSMDEIALAYGTTVGDLKALYRRGQAAGWGRP